MKNWLCTVIYDFGWILGNACFENVVKMCEVNLVYVCVSEIKLPLLCFLRFSGSGNVQLNLPICTNGKTWNNGFQVGDILSSGILSGDILSRAIFACGILSGDILFGITTINTFQIRILVLHTCISFAYKTTPKWRAFLFSDFHSLDGMIGEK